MKQKSLNAPSDLFSKLVLDDATYLVKDCQIRTTPQTPNFLRNVGKGVESSECGSRFSSNHHNNPLRTLPQLTESLICAFSYQFYHSERIRVHYKIVTSSVNKKALHGNPLLISVQQI